MRTGTGNFGFDAGTGKYVDLVEVGIIDPTKVVRLAAAGVLLLTKATMTEVPEPKVGAETPSLEAA
jgi:chaperonin GroEL